MSVFVGLSCVALQPRLIDISQAAVWDEDGQLVLHVGLLYVTLQPHTNLVHPPRHQVSAVSDGEGHGAFQLALMAYEVPGVYVLVDETFPTERC